MRKYRGVTKPGKLRYKLADLLNREGVIVQARDIRQNAPAYRRITQDGIAWEVWGDTLGEDRMRLFSYDTMRECCENGIEIRNCGDYLCEVSAKEKK